MCTLIPSLAYLNNLFYFFVFPIKPHPIFKNKFSLSLARDGGSVVVKSSGQSSRGFRFSSHHWHEGSYTLVTPFPGGITLSSGAPHDSSYLPSFLFQQSCMVMHRIKCTDVSVIRFPLILLFLTLLVPLIAFFLKITGIVMDSDNVFLTSLKTHLVINKTTCDLLIELTSWRLFSFLKNKENVDTYLLQLRDNQSINVYTRSLYGV